jgi:hypothetical protein
MVEYLDYAPVDKELDKYADHKFLLDEPENFIEKRGRFSPIFKLTVGAGCIGAYFTFELRNYLDRMASDAV